MQLKITLLIKQFYTRYNHENYKISITTNVYDI